jgi:O-antigen/teichoic acid export membrane protein
MTALPRDRTQLAGPAGAGVAGRLRAHLRNPLFTNVYALTLNTVVSSLLGIGYWIIAARLYSPQELGAGAAIVSTMTFLSNLSQLNLNGALARFLPASGRNGGRLIRYAYGASCAVAVLLAAGFLVVAPRVSDRVGVLSRSPLLAVAFVLGVAAWGVFTLQDSVLTALRGAVWVPVENAAYGLAKIIALVLLAAALPGLGIFLSWSLPVLVALVPVNLLVFRRLLNRPRRGPQVGTLPARRALVRFVTLDYVGFLFLQAGTNALPVLVTAVLGAGANAAFYLGWLLGGSLELVAYHFGTSLTVESAANVPRLAHYARDVLRRGLLLLGAGAVVLVACAPLLLAPFGAQYAEASSTVLRLFALAVLPKFVVTVFVATCRVRQRVGPIVLVQATTCVLVVSVAVLTMRSFGVAAVGFAYLAGQLVVAAAVLPALLRVLRGAR